MIQNAIEAMPNGGCLTITTRRTENTCELIVADTGEGIAEQEAPLIFMPFFGTREGGMGLGLAMAHRIAERHQGDLRLLFTSEAGSAFGFRLPLRNLLHPLDEIERSLTEVLDPQ